MTGPAQLLARRPAHLLLPLGIALAVGAAAAAPSTELLPGPAGTVETLVAAAALAAAFAAGYLAPLRALYALVLVIVLEGAVRKWAVNDITVFLLKDFLALGIYAAVLPRLSRAELRRPWWLLAPLAGLLVLAVAYAPLAAAPDQAAIGLRTYAIFVPLVWVAPALLGTRRAALGMLLLIVAVGSVQSVLATVQVVAGAGVLNASLPGTPVGTNTIGGQGYLRPSGTFLQTGTLSGLLVFALVASAALVAAFRRGPLVWGALAGMVFFAVGVVYTSARTLFGSTVLVVAALLVYLLLRRRLLSLVAVPAAFLVGIGLVFTVVPRVGPTDPAAGRAKVAHVVGGETVLLEVSTDGARSEVAAGFLRRAVDLSKGGGRVGIWEQRIQPNLRLVGEQRLIGHGTGTMTLGARYSSVETTLLGESSFVRVAWELGLPGLLLFLWLLAAFAVGSALGVRRAQAPWERALALTALGAAGVLPFWLLITFTFEIPIVQALYFLLVGAGVAVARAADSSDPNDGRASTV